MKRQPTTKKALERVTTFTMDPDPDVPANLPPGISVSRVPPPQDEDANMGGEDDDVGEGDIVQVPDDEDSLEPEDFNPPHDSTAVQKPEEDYEDVFDEEEDDEEDEEDDEEDEEDEEDEDEDEEDMSQEDDDSKMEAGSDVEELENDDDPSMMASEEDSMLSSASNSRPSPVPKEAPKRGRKPVIPILKIRPIESGASSPASSTGGHLPAPKRRGRPSKAEMIQREKEREARLARGEVEPAPTPKRRGRKPMPPELKARLLEEKKRERAAKAREKRRQKKEEEGIGGHVRKRRGRKARVWTEEEKEQREAIRKQKYEEFKKKKAEEKAKRAERNLALREYRKKKKEEEKKQREAYEKRMQELKASFLDENSHLSATGEEMLMLDENSQSSLNRSKAATFEMSQLNPIREVNAETLFEYRWPLGGKNYEHYFLQEQVCEYLGLKSFKRRYPDIPRRNCEAEERDFLVEMKVVNETQADLGLMALPSTSVLDIMSNDFYEKYDEYMAVVSERKDRTIRQSKYIINSFICFCKKKNLFL